MKLIKLLAYIVALFAILLYAQDTTTSGSATVRLVPVVEVTVEPQNVILYAGDVQQFTATVTGSPNKEVTWSVEPPIGTITQTGLYTAPDVIEEEIQVEILATHHSNPE